MSRRAVLSAAGAVALAAGAAGGQVGVNEDFDCYDVGAAASALPGWEVWPDPPGQEAFVTGERAFSGTSSLHLNQTGADVVRQVWLDSVPVTFRVMTFVPSEAVASEAYVLAMDSYDGGGAGTSWAMQVRFDTVLGVVEALFGGQTTPLIFDRWVELRAEIDLAGGRYDLYYDGVAWAQDLSWFQGVHGYPLLAAIEFYMAFADGPGIYIDDVVVTEAGVALPPTCGTLCYADCDGSGEVDVFDFLCFQNLFAAGDARADCDQDGGLTFFDFLCFQNEFAAGCP